LLEAAFFMSRLPLHLNRTDNLYEFSAAAIHAPSGKQLSVLRQAFSQRSAFMAAAANCTNSLLTDAVVPY
jgi:hypothetical protein